MMDIQQEVISMAAAAAGKIPELRGTRDSGRFANTVRIAAPQGSSFDGLTGRVVRVVDGTVFVRLSFATLPFAAGELEVLS
jgi:hypothetical protein